MCLRKTSATLITAVTLAFSPFTSYTKEEDSHTKEKDLYTKVRGSYTMEKDSKIRPGHCVDFRILDTIAQFYDITVRTRLDSFSLPLFPPLRWT